MGQTVGSFQKLLHTICTKCAGSNVDVLDLCPPLPLPLLSLKPCIEREKVLLSTVKHVGGYWCSCMGDILKTALYLKSAGGNVSWQNVHARLQPFICESLEISQSMISTTEKESEIK